MAEGVQDVAMGVMWPGPCPLPSGGCMSRRQVPTGAEIGVGPG